MGGKIVLRPSMLPLARRLYCCMRHPAERNELPYDMPGDQEQGHSASGQFADLRGREEEVLG